MSNNHNSQNRDRQDSIHNLHICLFSPDEHFTQLLRKILTKDRYVLIEIRNEKDFIESVAQQKEQIDCLVFINKSSWQNLLSELKKIGIILPTVIINADTFDITDGILKPFDSSTLSRSEIYHNAEIQLDAQKIDQILSYINFAITQFLNLGSSCSLIEHSTQINNHKETNSNFLTAQQQRLSQKLQERLGYLGVYYKRNSQDFYHNLKTEGKQEFIKHLSQEYHKIILSYFDDLPEINQLIDNFVDEAFFADISISQILEIHMDLMGEFAEQLKLEGRSEEILLDYRLALIDIIAHLCEMYRRSIPRENRNSNTFDILFP